MSDLVKATSIRSVQGHLLNLVIFNSIHIHFDVCSVMVKYVFLGVVTPF